jgi:GT2 family glycosyltransferase
VKSRIHRIARRFKRFGNVLFPLLAVPYVRGRRGVNVIDRHHYGLAIGRAFADAEEAARHYFRTGWRLGIVPNAVIDYPGARFSLLASLRLRNDLARLARTGLMGTHAGRPSRLLDLPDFRQRHPELVAARSGIVGAVMMLPDSQRDRLVLNARNRTLTWAEYREEAVRLIPASRTVLDHTMMDVAFYSSQVGDARFVSTEAALDDYLANGERDGRSPHPFFEAEWYEDHERSQVRSGRPINQFLDFVVKGQLGEAGPHYWGQRYANLLAARGEQPPEHPFAHFMRISPRQQLTPSSAEVVSVPKDQADAATRARVREYHRSLERLSPRGPVLPRHTQIPAGTPATASVLVFVDARLLTAEYARDLVLLGSRQTHGSLTTAIVGSDSVAPAQYFSDDDLASIRGTIVDRDPDERFGAAMQRVLAEREPDAWTVWTPAQEWAPEYVETLSGALATDPGAQVAVAVTPTAPQTWLRTGDALWASDLENGGVLVRTGARGLSPASLDVGVLADIALRVSEGAAACWVAETLFEVRADHRDASMVRAGENSARASRLLGANPQPPSGVGVTIPTFEDWRMTLDAVKTVLARSGPEVRITVVDNGSRRPVATLLAAALVAERRVTVTRLPRNTDFALGCNIGANLLNARTVVFLNNDTLVQENWLEPLLARLADSGVVAAQPLLLYGDRTVQTAGTIFVGGVSMPRHLLSGHHSRDVDPAIDRYRFSALTAACVAIDYEDFRSVGGFDTRYVNGMEDIDLCLALRRNSGGALRVCTDSTVIHLESKTQGRGAHILSNRQRFLERWQETLVTELDDRGVLDDTPLEITDVRWLPQGKSPLREPEIIVSRRNATAISVDESAPRLRWAIKISSTGDSAGDTWGDEYFARDLARALERLGQTTVIDRSTSHTRAGSDEWDDVTLTLRGLVPFLPQPDAVNILWIISHPDMVTGDEMRSGFDRVYAAGAGWASAATKRWGVPVGTMLQATDATRFTPDARDAHHSDGVLFVGRTRAVSRPIVRDAIAAGLDVQVYGDDGWEQFIPRRYIRGSGVANDALPRAYANAGVVLNDHWPDMARQGFFSNRLFDAAASGARIISDGVPGIEEIFGDQVRVYSDVASLRGLVDDDAWPDAERMRTLSQAVRENHSFDARAGQLLDDAIRARSAKTSR